MPNEKPRLIGFLCENGAYAFYDVSNPVRRKLPANFVGLPVASIAQVQTNEVLKAFLSGADGVLIGGCETCGGPRNRQQIDRQLAEIEQALAGFGIDHNRLRVAWISAADKEKFLRVVHAMVETLQLLPALQLPAGLGKSVAYCG